MTLNEVIQKAKTGGKFQQTSQTPFDSKGDLSVGWRDITESICWEFLKTEKYFAPEVAIFRLMQGTYISSTLTSPTIWYRFVFNEKKGKNYRLGPIKTYRRIRRGSDDIAIVKGREVF